MFVKNTRQTFKTAEEMSNVNTLILRNSGALLGKWAQNLKEDLCLELHVCGEPADQLWWRVLP